MTDSSRLGSITLTNAGIGTIWERLLIYQHNAEPFNESQNTEEKLIDFTPVSGLITVTLLISFHLKIRSRQIHRYFAAIESIIKDIYQTSLPSLSSCHLYIHVPFFHR
jgi:hypothetical protein